KVPIIYRTCELTNWKGGNTYQKFLEFNPEKRYDVLVLGSSHAYRGYDPRIFKSHGLEMFNLGTSAQSALNSYFVAKDYIKPGKVGLVILDVFDGALMSDGLESASDLIANLPGDNNVMDMAVACRDPRMLNLLTLRWLDRGNEPLYKDSTYIAKGFSQNTDSLKHKPSYKNYYKDKEPEKRQLYFLSKILAYFSSNKIPCIMTNYPLPKEWDRKGHARFAREIKRLAREWNTDFFDFSGDLDLHPIHHYYDAHHLNQAGVNIYNLFLLEQLKKNRIIHE
ncbi:MAG TPA: hypothetical protein VD905_07360, partial [Flavobacteriales bacterium]|nr:hypothetical protein [Flavobacteriales bacterium]